jgi:formyltetrahydrofolate synthetase
MLKSFERLEELLSALINSKMDWRRDITIDLIRRCLDINERLFEKLKIMHLNEKTVKDINTHKDKVIGLISLEIEPEKKETPTIEKIQ